MVMVLMVTRYREDGEFVALRYALAHVEKLDAVETVGPETEVSEDDQVGNLALTSVGSEASDFALEAMGVTR
jgi:hypothetical protein